MSARIGAMRAAAGAGERSAYFDGYLYCTLVTASPGPDAMLGPPRPNFFIVGAPRCGTTAMYVYLRAHPDVFMPYYKEPVFFGADLNKRSRTFDEQAYLELFANSRGERRLGEATVWYLYSQTAATEIKAFAPDARIIIMLRNPVEMIHSLHSLMLLTGNEDIADFEEALAAEPDRSRGLRIPKGARRVEGLQYRACGRYATHVRRYLDTFGTDAVKVVLYDDLRADPRRVYRGVLEFLGVDAAFEPDFSIVNRNSAVRFRPLQRLTASPAFIRATSRLPGPILHKLRKGIKRLNMRPESRPPISDALRARLAREFAPDVDELGRIIGRDLASWTATGDVPATGTSDEAGA
jgi:hypothetical protein